jgi:DNA-binding response OmpR family regulator
MPIHKNAPIADVDLEAKQVSIGETAVPKLQPTEINGDANHILIVEDNADMARYITSCLNQQYVVTHALNGQIGLEMAIAKTPDLIVTDVMMPVMDGLEMTKELQSSEATNHIPIVMLTSKAMQEDRMDGITSGADVYLTKPFSKKELQLRIETLISKRQKLQEKYQNGLLSETIVSEEPKADKNEIFLRKVVSEIHNELDNGDFNSSSLAINLALSDSQLYRKLKAITNRSTAVFIRKVRLEKAKELLLETEKTISEIAYETGFNDPNWFGKAFKEEFGQAPSEIRI